MNTITISLFLSVYAIFLLLYCKFCYDIDDIGLDFHVLYKRFICQHVAELEKNPQVVADVKDSPYRTAEFKRVLPAYPIQVVKYHKYYFAYLSLQKQTYIIYSSLLVSLGQSPSIKFCLFIVGAMISATFFQYRLREKTKKLYEHCKEISEAYENSKPVNRSGADLMMDFLSGTTGPQGISGSIGIDMKNKS